MFLMKSKDRPKSLGFIVWHHGFLYEISLGVVEIVNMKPLKSWFKKTLF